MKPGRKPTTILPGLTFGCVEVIGPTADDPLKYDCRCTKCNRTFTKAARLIAKHASYGVRTGCASCSARAAKRPLPPGIEARNVEIAHLRAKYNELMAEGRPLHAAEFTLAKIGAKYGLSRERVRQIADKYLSPSRETQ
jgi:hypothetical protein